MNDQLARHRRNPEQVVGSAALVGLAAGLIIVVVVGLASVFVQALNESGSLRQAFGAMVVTDAEDWELIPMFLAGAAVAGAVCSVAAVVVCCEITRRRPARPWLARAGAAAAAGAPVLLLLAAMSFWGFAVAVAVAAALVAAIAAPLVGCESPPSPVSAAHP